MSMLSRKRRKKPNWFGTSIIVILAIWSLVVMGTGEDNDQQVFTYQDPSFNQSHLNTVNPQTDLKSNGFMGIDRAHRDGRVHTGSWIYVIDTSLANNDSSPRILLLKRDNQLVTCPGTWGLIGEHTYRDESPIATARRAIYEELGNRLLVHVQKSGSIRSLTQHPVLYDRHYGPDNGDRIDRQVTYLWLVELNLPVVDRVSAAERLLDLDGEVSEHTWIDLKVLEKWVMNNSTETSLDFCHSTITSLIALGLRAVKGMAGG